jgi:hypothetical protein
MNILVISVGGPSSFSGVITTPNTVNKLVSGIPQMFHISPNRLLKCQSLVSNRDNSSIVITSFSSVMPTLMASLPSNPANVMRSSEGMVVFQANPADVNQFIQFQLKSTNASVISVLYHESINYDTRAVSLISGLPQRDVVTAQLSHYFVFSVPAGIQGEVKFIVESIEVNQLFIVSLIIFILILSFIG